MSLLPESIKEGRCYLADSRAYPQVRQVLHIHSDGRVLYRSRPPRPVRDRWTRGVCDIKAFALAATREVPYDWVPEREG
jgi:hypothetical protein